jgi:hypothetical protein
MGKPSYFSSKKFDGGTSMNIDDLIKELSKYPRFIEVKHIEAFGKPSKDIICHIDEDDGCMKLYL